MDKSIFNDIVSRPYKFTFNEKREIQSAKSKYPYCAPLQILDLLSDKACAIPNWETSQTRSKLYATSNKHLESLLNATLPASTIAPETETIKQEIAATKKIEQAQSEPFDVMKEINTYQEVSFKTAPKSVILSKFLESGPSFEAENAPENAIPIEELAKKSIQDNQSVETETLAVILEKQGKYEKAISIYEKLSSLNPEKSSIFASRILSLKNKIENK